MGTTSGTNQKALSGAVKFSRKKTRPIWQIKNDITKVEICTNLDDDEKESMTNLLELELVNAKMKRPV